MSQKQKDKLSRVLTGRTLSQKHKDNISKTRIGKYIGEKHPMFGKHHSQKTKDKMRQARLGEKNPNYGKHHSQEAKDKMSAVQLGKKRPYVAELNRQRTGKKNPNYINGKGYDPYPPEFIRIIEEIRQRDGYRCQKCGRSELEKGKKLAVHHIDYDKENCSRENLIALCLRCNTKVNTNRKKWTKYFQKKVAIGYQQKQLCLARS